VLLVNTGRKHTEQENVAIAENQQPRWYVGASRVEKDTGQQAECNAADNRRQQSPSR
jgi:hypothetical protein